jgi:RNA polymerase sigma factor (sigma-70 family)
MPSALLRLRSDDQLVALFRAGSDDAFRVIHDRYRARLFAYTRQMLGGSRSDAEDALQDVFLRAYNALRVDDRPIVLKAWLYRVAHNRCIDHLRRPVPPAADVFEASRSPLPDPLAECERRDDLRRLVADVQRLPEQQRSALLMRELEGLSYADLAVALETTIPAVKSLLVRARIGLVEASEARNTACAEIRNDLALSFGKGVRASALARRHMRECQGCRQYRTDLRGVQSGLSSLMPGGHPLGLLTKLLGIGGASGGAAAGGSAAAGGGAAVVGGGVVAGTTAKVAAVVCCAAITAGGAVEIKRQADPKRDARTSATPASATPGAKARSAAGPTAIDARRTAAPAVAGRRATARKAAARRRAAAAEAARRKAAGTVAPAAAGVAGEEAISPHALDEPLSGTPVGAEDAATGGALAPDEPLAAVPGATATDSAPPAEQESEARAETITAQSTGTAEPSSGAGQGGSAQPAGAASSGSTGAQGGSSAPAPSGG